MSVGIAYRLFVLQLIGLVFYEYICSYHNWKGHATKMPVFQGLHDYYFISMCTHNIKLV